MSNPAMLVVKVVKPLGPLAVKLLARFYSVEIVMGIPVPDTEWYPEAVFIPITVHTTEPSVALRNDWMLQPEEKVGGTFPLVSAASGREGIEAFSVAPITSGRSGRVLFHFRGQAERDRALTCARLRLTVTDSLGIKRTAIFSTDSSR